MASWPSRGRSSGGRLTERLEQAGDEPALAREVPVADRPQLRLGRALCEIDLELLPEVSMIRMADRQARSSRLTGQAAHAAQSSALGRVNRLSLTNRRQARAAGLASAAAFGEHARTPSGS